MKTISIALILASVACAKSEADETRGNGPAVGAAPQTVAVRLKGVQPSGSVRVRVAALDLTVDGQAISTQVSSEEIDLGTDPSVGELMKFALPADARTVAVSLRFQPEGSVERNGKTVALDLRGPPITFVADAALMRTRSRVIVDLDLSRSVVDHGGQVFLLPDLRVRY